MFLAYGSVIIQSSQEMYVGVDSASDEADKIDEIVKSKDEKLIKEMELWLNENQSRSSLFKFQFTPYLNNDSGIFQFHTSRNHFCAFTWECVQHIADNSQGSYGLVHVHDDENFEFGLEVWRILDGKITKQTDEFFTPFKSPHAFGGTNYWVHN